MEAVLFMGIQAVGKSTFYQERFFKTHMRINLDMLKTRHREDRFLQVCLETSQPFVVDNTNPTREARAKYIQLAQAYGVPVIGYYFQSRVDDAIRRNASRSGKECVPGKAILGTHRQLQIPSFDEGFNKLFYVMIDQDGHFVVQAWKDEV